MNAHKAFPGDLALQGLARHQINGMNARMAFPGDLALQCAAEDGYTVHGVWDLDAELF